MLYSLVETLPLFRLSKLKPTSKLQAIKMQATLHLSPISSVSSLAFATTKSLALPCSSLPRPLQPSRCPPLRATNVTDDPSSVDYSSITSVFPAEACETVGGEACDAEMYPEVKLKPEEGRSSTARTSSEQLDRDYLEYDSPKTVFPGEACDDLGGEFCEPEYQKGVN
ncbi:light-regulated protein, chloroplastic-like [Pyrus x bretschneideri]|nr:light-regulated protein, chloroplastic-like [Pyrus x bretschneideri]